MLSDWSSIQVAGNQWQPAAGVVIGIDTGPRMVAIIKCVRTSGVGGAAKKMEIPHIHYFFIISHWQTAIWHARVSVAKFISLVFLLRIRFAPRCRNL
jgi:hypothetical protein